MQARQGRHGHQLQQQPYTKYDSNEKTDDVPTNPATLFL
jgi:hypothetical protein